MQTKAEKAEQVEKAEPANKIIPARKAAKASASIDSHPLAFTGSGREYFRVWIVNVLLSLLTLGFYTPLARRRTAQYFYGHTLVADSPLEFTGQSRKMFFGFLLLVVLYSGFKLAANSGNQVAVNVFLVVGAVCAPYFWASAMRFRLGSTRWRGVRLQFAAPWKEVYLASWPIFALALVWMVAGAVFALVLPEFGASAAKLAAPPVSSGMVWTVVGVGLVATVLSMLCIIRLSFNYQSLLVQRASIGTQAGRWKPVYADFVRIWLATAGLFLLVLLIMGLLTGALITLVMGAMPRPDGPMRFILVAVFVVVMLLSLLLALAPVRAYREARMFRLVWGNVGVSSIARFKCALRPRRYVGLRIKNILLTLLTLGLYRPFARASEYAMKINSVTLHVKGGVDQLAGQLVAQQDALGDALADAVGLDLIT